MRAVIQRVSSANVKVDGAVVGEIRGGLLAFIGVQEGDNVEEAEWLAGKLPHVRIFDDGDGHMNRSVLDSGGDILVISQFTLFGTLRKGTRPSFNRAARPEEAVPLYEVFLSQLETALGRPVPRGVFGAHMVIDAVNDGPVTLVIDTRNRDL